MVEVTYADTAEGPRIYVGKGPDRLEWSTDMWESSVWQPIVDGTLPVGAAEEGHEPDHGVIARPAYHGGAVVWGGRRYGPKEWPEFERRIRVGELSVEALRG